MFRVPYVWVPNHHKLLVIKTFKNYLLAINSGSFQNKPINPFLAYLIFGNKRTDSDEKNHNSQGTIPSEI
jgi:hypothetical protein